MPQLSVTMFTEVESFTTPMQAGEAEAPAAVNRHRNVVRGAVEEHRAEEVRLHGDGTLFVFVPVCRHRDPLRGDPRLERLSARFGLPFRVRR